jgi:hypothetical protein
MKAPEVTDIMNKMIKISDFHFAVAPMMDWTDVAEKAKHNQNLSMVAVSHAVPNAVLTIFK